MLYDFYYMDLLRAVEVGDPVKNERTGVVCRTVFGFSQRIDINACFPILSCKKVAFRWVLEELLWFLSGSTNEKDLRDKGVDIWKEWATKEKCEKFGRQEGDLGPVYGHQWRSFGGKVDQIKKVIDSIKSDPSSRRHIVSAWNPMETDLVELPPCHTLFQFNVREGRFLDILMYQRSADVILGVPFNVCAYALLNYMICVLTGLVPGYLYHTIGNAHIYENHLSVLPRLYSNIDNVLDWYQVDSKKWPYVTLTHGETPINTIDDFKSDMFKLMNYSPVEEIKVPVVV